MHEQSSFASDHQLDQNHALTSSHSYEALGIRFRLRDYVPGGSLRSLSSKRNLFGLWPTHPYYFCELVFWPTGSSMRGCVKRSNAMLSHSFDLFRRTI